MVSAFQATSSLSGIHVYRPFLHMWNVFKDPSSVEFQEYIGKWVVMGITSEFLLKHIFISFTDRKCIRLTQPKDQLNAIMSCNTANES